jgi:Ca2+-binding RTX toxin-like protein
VTGGAGDDQVWGFGGGEAVLDGGGGHDTLSFRYTTYTPFVGELDFPGPGGDVTLEGATIRGFEGGSVELGRGRDVVTLGEGADHWTVSGGLGSDQLTGSRGSDTLSGGDGADTVRGMRGDDQFSEYDASLVEGGGGDDTIQGYSGAETLSGGAGDDLITDSYGASVLKGGAGVDTLSGGAQSDTLQGGAGRDLYTFHGAYESIPREPDLIDDADFGVVDLGAVQANNQKGHADDPFTLVDHFSGAAGELVIRYSADDGLTHVEGDTDGDGRAELVILITGDHTDAADYVL